MLCAKDSCRKPSIDHPSRFCRSCRKAQGMSLEPAPWTYTGGRDSTTPNAITQRKYREKKKLEARDWNMTDEDEDGSTSDGEVAQEAVAQEPQAVEVGDVIAPGEVAMPADSGAIPPTVLTPVWACPKCGSKDIKSRNRVSHVVICTGEKPAPWACPKCGRRDIFHPPARARHTASCDGLRSKLTPYERKRRNEKIISNQTKTVESAPVSMSIESPLPEPKSFVSSPKDIVDIEPTLTIRLTGKALTLLEGLLKTGLYGHTIEDAAERLLCRGIESVCRRI